MRHSDDFVLAEGCAEFVATLSAKGCVSATEVVSLRTCSMDRIRSGTLAVCRELIGIESARRPFLRMIGAAAELFGKTTDYLVIRYASVTAFSAEV